jgi:hypothetical protein
MIGNKETNLDLFEFSDPIFYRKRLFRIPLNPKMGSWF